LTAFSCAGLLWFVVVWDRCSAVVRGPTLSGGSTLVVTRSFFISLARRSEKTPLDSRSLVFYSVLPDPVATRRAFFRPVRGARLGCSSFASFVCTLQTRPLAVEFFCISGYFRFVPGGLVLSAEGPPGSFPPDFGTPPFWLVFKLLCNLANGVLGWTSNVFEFSLAQLFRLGLVIPRSL